MKLLLDLDTDTSYIYIVDKNYDGDHMTRDLLAFEFITDFGGLREEYFLRKMTRPLRDGKLNIIGVDIL